MCSQLLKKKLTAASEARHPSLTASVSLRQAATALRQVWLRSCKRDAAIHGDGNPRSMSGTKIAGDALISALSFAEHSCLQLMSDGVAAHLPVMYHLHGALAMHSCTYAYSRTYTSMLYVGRAHKHTQTQGFRRLRANQRASRSFAMIEGTALSQRLRQLGASAVPLLVAKSMLASLPPPELPSAAHGPYNLDTPGALHAAVQSHSRGGELILLHADRRRLRLLLNLIAELAAWDSHHIFVLGFTATVCADLAQAGSTVGCGYTSYLRAGPLAADVVKSGISFNYVAWLQKSHLLRRLIEEESGVNVLALDTDMTVHAPCH